MFYKLVLIFALLLTTSCGGNYESITQLVGTWSANAYQVHDNGTSSTIWLNPMVITAGGTVTGSFIVQEYPAGTTLEAGTYDGSVGTKSYGEVMTLTFPPRPGEPKKPSRTLGIIIASNGSGQANGWGFGSQPDRSDFIFGMQRQ